MFKGLYSKKVVNEQAEKERLNNLSEKELLIEVFIELKKVSEKCDNLARQIIVWSD